MISPETLYGVVNGLGLASVVMVVAYHFITVNGKYCVAQDAREMETMGVRARS